MTIFHSRPHSEQSHRISPGSNISSRNLNVSKSTDSHSQLFSMVIENQSRHKTNLDKVHQTTMACMGLLKRHTHSDPMDLFCRICLSKVVTWTSHARQVCCFKYMCMWATACDALYLCRSMGRSCHFHQSDLDTQGFCMHHHRTAVSGVWIST